MSHETNETAGHAPAGQSPQAPSVSAGEPAQRELVLTPAPSERDDSSTLQSSVPDSKLAQDIPLDAPAVYVPVRGLGERFRRRFHRLLTSRARRLFLQVGLPWIAAVLVGLVSVLYARSTASA